MARGVTKLQDDKQRYSEVKGERKKCDGYEERATRQLRVNFRRHPASWEWIREDELRGPKENDVACDWPI